MIALKHKEAPHKPINSRSGEISLLPDGHPRAEQSERPIDKKGRIYTEDSGETGHERARGLSPSGPVSQHPRGDDAVYAHAVLARVGRHIYVVRARARPAGRAPAARNS